MNKFFRELALSLMAGGMIGTIQWIIHRKDFFSAFLIVSLGMIGISLLLRMQDLVVQRRLRPQYLRVVPNERRDAHQKQV